MGERGRDTTSVETCSGCGATVTDAEFCQECGAPLDATLAEECGDCGERFHPDDRFCSTCGALRNPDRQDSPSEDDEEADEEMEQFRSRIQAHLATGWELEHDYGDSVVLVDRSWGNPLAHVALLLLTGGIGNILYGWYNYAYSADHKRLSADETPADPQPVETLDTDTDEDYGGWGRAIGGVFLLLLGFLFVVSDPLDLTNWVFGIVTLASGVFVFPPSRRRLANRHATMKVGQVRTTNEKIVSAPQTPCVVCGRPVERGIRRTFREEVALVGIPLFRTKDGENHYCDSCAMVDPELDTSGLSIEQSGSVDGRSGSGEESLDRTPR